MSGRGVAVALAGWTLLVWVGRVRNVLANDELSGWSSTWRLAVAVAFVGIGLALAGMIVKDRHLPLAGSAAAGVAVSLAVVGSAWWVVRGTGILAGDYAVGFKVVHTLLATVTVVLSGLVLRSLAPSAADRYHRARYG